jgi:DNA-directed RNA polymerase subunit L
MRVNSSKGSPLKEIQRATESAIEFTNDLKQIIHSKLKGV